MNDAITTHVDSERRRRTRNCGATDVRLRQRRGSGVLRGAGQSSSTKTAAVIASSAAGLTDDQERIRRGLHEAAIRCRANRPEGVVVTVAWDPDPRPAASMALSFIARGQGPQTPVRNYLR